MHLILGVDDSPYSAAAVEFVRKMSWPSGTTVTVIYSLAPIAVVVPEAQMAMAQEMEALRRELLEANTKHVKIVESELASSGIKATGKATDGDPRTVLVDAARAEHADLVVLGSHGRTGLTKLLMGSVASHVMTHAPCSVLVVRRSPA